MKKVITYGTFDLFHEGHRRLLERARALGDYLIVGVTSDEFDRERGKLNVKDSLAERIEAVRATGFADEIIVEEYLGQKLSDVLRLGIAVFAIGSDWKGKFDYLLRHCEVVYLERTKGVSSTALREVGTKMLRIGVVTDTMDDGGIVSEACFVSGLEVTGAFLVEAQAEEHVKTAAFCESYDLQTAFDSLEALIAGNDAIYVHTRRRHRFGIAEAALRRGCHVICDFPLNDPEEAHEIYRLAEESGAVFAECVPLAYLRTFHQLIWLLHGGVIGQAFSVDCTMPVQGDFRDSGALAAFAVTRILGTEGAAIRRISIGSRQRYDRIDFSYADAAGTCSVSDSEWLQPGMTVLGTGGRIDVPGAWWNMSYFRLQAGGGEEPRHYSFNVEGSGLRYLLVEVTRMLAAGRRESIALGHVEAQRLTELLKQGDLL